MWAKASILRIGPFLPPRRTPALVVDDGRALTLDEPAVIDEARARRQAGEAADSHSSKETPPFAVADDSNRTWLRARRSSSRSLPPWPTRRSSLDSTLSSAWREKRDFEPAPLGVARRGS